MKQVWGGQTYAYDFLWIICSEKGFKFITPSNYKYWLYGITLHECPGYGEPIYAPFSGVVMESHDGCPERQRMHPLIDYLRVVKNSLIFKQGKEKGNGELIPMLRNYLIIKIANTKIYALFAHPRPASVVVGNDQEIAIGQKLSQVGHTGNSTAPPFAFSAHGQG